LASWTITSFSRRAPLHGIGSWFIYEVKSTVFWVVTQCRSEKARRFGGIYRLSSQSKSEPSKKPAEAGGKLSLISASVGFLLGLPFDP
jgi:hypothetical protein